MIFEIGKGLFLLRCVTERIFAVISGKAKLLRIIIILGGVYRGILRQIRKMIPEAITG